MQLREVIIESLEVLNRSIFLNLISTSIIKPAVVVNITILLIAYDHKLIHRISLLLYILHLILYIYSNAESSV